jgi:hypothetical protein
MKLKFSKINIVLIFIFIVNIFVVNKAIAGEIFFDPSNAMYHKEELVKIGVHLLPAEHEFINALDINVKYPSDLLTFVGSDDSNSIVSLWVEKPKVNDGVVEFSGIIPGGFNSLINPLSNNPILDRKSVPVINLIFKVKNSGNGSISVVDSSLSLNDGDGTQIVPTSNPFSFNVDEKILIQEDVKTDTIPPDDFIVLLNIDPLIFDGKPYIIFNTKDKQSGIDHYEIKEEGYDWVVGESPYKIKNDEVKGVILVKAIDRAGNFTYGKYGKEKINRTSYALIAGTLITIFIASKAYLKSKKIT